MIAMQHVDNPKAERYYMRHGTVWVTQLYTYATPIYVKTSMTTNSRFSLLLDIYIGR